MPVHTSAVCPSCDRFIGPADVCPYCDADSARPAWWRTLRWAAAAIAVIGMAVLHAAAVLRPVPRVQAGALTPLMNFATVRVTGTLVARPYVRGAHGAYDATYAMRIDDGTGRLRAAAYGDCAAGLAEKVPPLVRGSAVEVTGRLALARDGTVWLRISRPGDVRPCAGVDP